MRTLFAVILFLAWTSTAQANTLNWTDNSNNETGFAIEMLSKGIWTEVARVGANVTTYIDAFAEGVYRVRAFLTVSDGTTVFSTYSNTAALLNAPANATVK